MTKEGYSRERSRMNPEYRRLHRKEPFVQRATDKLKAILVRVLSQLDSSRDQSGTDPSALDDDKCYRFIDGEYVKDPGLKVDAGVRRLIFGPTKEGSDSSD